jgi:LysM repeat protein
LVVGFVGVRVWTALHTPDVRYVRIEPRPLASATTLVALTEDVGAEEAGETPESEGEQSGPALSPLPPPYTVAAGDTLIDIAGQRGTTVELLRLINDLENPNLLRTGQVLVIPPAQSTIQPADPTQSLREIARTHEVDPAVLAAYNGLPPERSNEPLGRPAVLLPVRAQ